MRFGAIGMKRPEDFLKTFRIYRAETETSSRGRERIRTPDLIGEERCILSEMKPEERLKFGQMGVTVTHTIFHQGAPAAKENDIFVLRDGEEEARFFRVQEVRNHGEMAIFTTYYCEERGDINGLHD